jgi:hypothetical protein
MLMPSLILTAMLGPAAPDSNEKAWSYVPAAHNAQSITGLVLSGPPTESIVTLVGTVNAAAVSATVPRDVFAFGIPSLPEGRVAPSPTRESTTRTVPAEARWPDAQGRIVTGPSKQGSPPKIAGIRNPWEIRIYPKVVGGDTVFQCGGIITGGDGGSVAILNGRIVRRGDSLGEFSVASVVASGVMLERNGSYFVIPLGRRTTVSTADG